MTVIIKSNVATSPNTNTPLPLASLRADEKIKNLPGLVAWFDAASGVVDPGNGIQGSGQYIKWTDIINGYEAVAMSDTGPSRVVDYNEQYCLRFVPTGRNGRMIQGPGLAFPSVVNHHIVPANADFSICCVIASPIAGGQNTAWIGTDAAASYFNFGRASTNLARVRHQDPTAVVTTPVAPPLGTPVVYTYSYNYETKAGVLYVNGTVSASGTADHEVLSAATTFGQCDSGSFVFRGDIYRALFFDRPYADAGNADDLLTLHESMAARFPVF